MPTEGVALHLVDCTQWQLTQPSKGASGETALVHPCSEHLGTHAAR